MTSLKDRKQMIKQAVEDGDLGRLIFLLENEEKTWRRTARDRYREAFKHAIVFDQAVIFEYLLLNGVVLDPTLVPELSWSLIGILIVSDWDINTIFVDGCTLLWHWLGEQDDETVCWLLEQGADPNVGNRAESKDPASNIPDIWKPDIVEMATCCLTKSTLGLLLAHGAKLENSIPLHAIALGIEPPANISETHDMVEYLQSLGLNINRIHKFDEPWPSMTPLEIAIGYGHIDMVRILLECGANPAVNGPDSAWARRAVQPNPAVIEMLEVFERSCQQDPEAMQELFGTELLPEQPLPTANNEYGESCSRRDGGPT